VGLKASSNAEPAGLLPPRPDRAQEGPARPHRWLPGSRSHRPM